MRFSEFLAPWHGGRVRLPGPNGLIWELPAPGPPGWSWWELQLPGTALWLRAASAREVDEHVRTLPTRPLKTVSEGRVDLEGRVVPLRLGEGVGAGQRVRAWVEHGLAWYLGPAAGSRRRTAKGGRGSPLESGTHTRARGPDLQARLARAVELGGGRLQGWTASPRGLSVVWSRLGVTTTSLIGEDLQVFEAGFCLSQTDRVHDLTSLVSLMAREE